MAYKYVPWARGVDGLKIAAKGVLMVLTDCAFIARDEKTGRELGYGLVTLPKGTLAEICGWKRSSTGSLDRELAILEDRGLIRIRRNKNPITNHRTPSDIHVLWKPWGDRAEDDGVSEPAPKPTVTSTPQGQTTTGVDIEPPRSNDHRGYGQTTIGGYGQMTIKEQGSSNKVLNTVPGDAGEGDSFQEWIDLFPSSKRKNPREARAKYGETINSGTTHQTLMDSTRAYISSLSEPRYISQALKVLTDRMWDKPEFKPQDPRVNMIRDHLRNAEAAEKMGDMNTADYHRDQINKVNARIQADKGPQPRKLDE